MKLRQLFLGLALVVPLHAAATAAPPTPPAVYPAHATPAAPYAGRPNYAHAAPVFQWGWFGAERQSPIVRRHRGYYGGHLEWTRNRW
ncbi:MAG: hypothetical protein AAF596_07010 [Planctomycetota bacterium]